MPGFDRASLVILMLFFVILSASPVILSAAKNLSRGAK